MLQPPCTGNICSPQGRLNAAPLIIPSNFHQKHQNKHNNFKILTQNTNGLRSRLPECLADVLAMNFNCYMLGETGLDPLIHSSELFPLYFNVYRCDRSAQTEAKQKKIKTRGGGVLIGIENTIKSQLIGTGEHYGAEQVWVRVFQPERNIILVQLYIRPDSPLDVYKANLDALRELISKVDPKDVILVSGDFNLPKLLWLSDDPDFPNATFPINGCSEREIEVLDTLHELGLFQINKHLNKNNKMLDLVWTSDTDIFNCTLSDSHLVKEEVHHPALNISMFEFFSRQNKNKNDCSDTFRNFINADYDKINNAFISVNWSETIKGTSLTEKVNNFYAVLKSIIDSHVELKVRKHSSHPKWFDKPLITMKNTVNKLHHNMKVEESNESKQRYIFYRREYKKSVRAAYESYKFELEDLIDENPQKFFEHVNIIKHNSDDLPSEMQLNNSTNADNWDDIAELFRQHFSTAYNIPKGDSIDTYIKNNNCISKITKLCSKISTINLTEEIIIERIKKLPNNLVSGPDDIPNLFLKNCMLSLLTPITELLRESLNTGEVPALWKKSFVKPVFKSGNRSKIENYRGVALQCVISKLLDSIIAHHINEHISTLVDDSQHGFIKGRSTITNLAEFTSCALINMEKRIQTDAIYIDIAKAFDSVDIKLLLHKLKIMQLNTQVLNWIESYLSDRQQIVKINGVKSNPIEVTSGTGQGYPIGATLFILFLIDLPFVVKDCHIQSFADDTRLWKQLKSLDDCQKLQDDLNRIVEYFKNNQLRLNVSKTKMISYYRCSLKFDIDYIIDGDLIERVHVIRDLGIILDEKMNFKAHADYMIAKAKSRLAWIKRFGYEFRDPWTFRRLYLTFVLPIIEYGSQIWNPHYGNAEIRMESIQKQFLLFALRRFPWGTTENPFILPSYEHRLMLFQMITLSERRKIAQIAFIFNVINGNISSNYIREKIIFKEPHYNIRNHDLLQLSLRKRNYSKYEPTNYMLSTFNEFYHKTLPNSDVKIIDFNVSIDTVKKRIAEYFKTCR